MERFLFAEQMLCFASMTVTARHGGGDEVARSRSSSSRSSWRRGASQRRSSTPRHAVVCGNSYETFGPDPGIRAAAAADHHTCYITGPGSESPGPPTDVRLIVSHLATTEVVALTYVV